MILKEIGLEVEFWLLDKKGNIVEAPKYNFPADEMGFLIEIRSSWGSDPNSIINVLTALYSAEEWKAHRLGLRIEKSAFKMVTRDWQDYIAKKYGHEDMRDYTVNIYGIKETQHTGFRNERATAGLHVHFSRFDTETETFLPFSKKEIEKIVMTLDTVFEKEISSTERIKGEWEPKSHGFEYRSLPATIYPLKVAKEALIVLQELS